MGEITGVAISRDMAGHQCTATAKAENEETQVQEVDEEDAKSEAKTGQAVISILLWCGVFMRGSMKDPA